MITANASAAERAGFANDLRDEALIGLVCLLFLAPLALMQTYRLDMRRRRLRVHACQAKRSRRSTGSPSSAAELAKAVPFVDYSEIFHVENASPIEAATPFGAGVVFFMRASLDLLLARARCCRRCRSLANFGCNGRLLTPKSCRSLSRLKRSWSSKRLEGSTPAALELRLDEQPALDAISTATTASACSRSLRMLRTAPQCASSLSQR